MSAVRLCLAVALGLTTLVCAQQPALPKPGPEHDVLKQYVGTWNATVKMEGMQSKGKAVYKPDLSGLWIINTFKGDFGGMKFEGHGIDGYDLAKKKYVSIWVDSMETAPLLSEGTYDEATKTLTMHGQGPGAAGATTRYTLKTQFKGKDAMVFTLSGRDKAGKDKLVMTIDYTRVK